MAFDNATPPARSWANAIAWARKELLLLVALGLASAALLAFAVLTGDVSRGETRAFDEAVLLAMRTPGDLSQPIGPAWLTTAALDITSLGGTTVVTLITALALGFLLLLQRYFAALMALVSIGGGTLVSTALKHLIARPRPDIVSHLVDVQSLSFPSGHAMLSAIVYLTIAALIAPQANDRRARVYLIGAAILLTLMIGCSRVYLGVHWPTDVLAGWVIGAAWATLCSVASWRWDASARRAPREPARADQPDA